MDSKHGSVKRSLENSLPSHFNALRCQFCGQDIKGENPFFDHLKQQHPERCPSTSNRAAWKDILSNAALSA
jgi:hypothetical protein